MVRLAAGMVQLLQTGRRSAKYPGTGRVDPTPYTLLFLAKVAQSRGTIQAIEEIGLYVPTVSNGQ